MRRVATCVRCQHKDRACNLWLWTLIVESAAATGSLSGSVPVCTLNCLRSESSCISDGLHAFNVLQERCCSASKLARMRSSVEPPAITAAVTAALRWLWCTRQTDRQTGVPHCMLKSHMLRFHSAPQPQARTRWRTAAGAMTQPPPSAGAGAVAMSADSSRA
jgi:hypothetical protein